MVTDCRRRRKESSPETPMNSRPPTNVPVRAGPINTPIHGGVAPRKDPGYRFQRFQFVAAWPCTGLGRCTRFTGKPCFRSQKVTKSHLPVPPVEPVPTFSKPILQPHSLTLTASPSFPTLLPVNGQSTVASPAARCSPSTINFQPSICRGVLDRNSQVSPPQVTQSEPLAEINRARRRAQTVR